MRHMIVGLQVSTAKPDLDRQVDALQQARMPP
jgi:hypothetical protein